MKILLINNHSKHLEELLELLSSFEVSVCDFKDLTDIKDSECDLIVISGGSHVPSVLDHSEVYQKEISLLKTTNTPVIGICLGCELIAKAFDCELCRLDNKEKRICQINMNNKKLEVYEAHRYAIEKVSAKIEILASSKDGAEIIKHKDKLIFGLQFHPEMFVEKTEGRKIFNNIIDQIFSKNSK